MSRTGLTSCSMSQVLYKVYVTFYGGLHRYSHARTDRVLVGRLPAARGEREARAAALGGGARALLEAGDLVAHVLDVVARIAAMEMCWVWWVRYDFGLSRLVPYSVRSRAPLVLTKRA